VKEVVKGRGEKPKRICIRISNDQDEISVPNVSRKKLKK
jgi:hypothetical protein